MLDSAAAGREAARRLVARQQSGASAFPDAGKAAEAISGRLRVVLVRWIGADAWQVVLQEALNDVRPSFPGLTGARCEAGRVIGLGADGSTPEAVVDGFAGLLGAVVERLARVVGEGMALRLLEQAAAPWPDDSSETTHNGEA